MRRIGAITLLCIASLFAIKAAIAQTGCDLSNICPVSGGGGISLVQQTGTTVAQVSSCTTCQIKLPSAATTGNFIGVAISYSPGSAIGIASVCDAVTSGACSVSLSTYSILSTVNVGPNNTITQIAYTCNAGIAPQYINLVMSTSAATSVGLMGVEVSGLSTSSCIDQTASATPTTATSPVTSGTFTTTSANEFALGIIGDEANCQTLMANGGNTALTTPTCTQVGMGGVYQIYSGIQTGVTFKIGISPTGDKMAFSVATFH